MPEIGEDEVRELLDKYQKKLNAELGTGDNLEAEPVDLKPVTREYLEFKEEYMPKHISYYEKLCNFAEKTFKIKPDEAQAKDIQESLDICHLNCTPTGTLSFGILAPVILVLVGILLTFIIFEGSLFMLIFFIGSAAGIYKPVTNIPKFMATSWRMKASGQMVLSIFYIVTYMRHTSNLELAIEFGSKHLPAPLSLDLKKVLWDVETEKYENVKESLDAYLQTWKKWKTSN